MNTKVLRIISVFWLAFITPFFGIIPLLLMLDVNIGYGTLHRLEGDILRLAWSIFFGDPSPEVTHAYPPMTNGQYWFMIVVVLTGATLAVSYCFSGYVKRHQAKMLK